MSQPASNSQAQCSLHRPYDLRKIEKESLKRLIFSDTLGTPRQHE